MLKITAIFESWHIGDGNYPPLHKGMAVNLSFQLQPAKLSVFRPPKAIFLHHLGNAVYDFCGKVIAIYNQEKIAVIETGDFLFYIESKETKNFKIGRKVNGRGTLLLDYYGWVEFLSRRNDPPDIFYTLEVARIQKVKIPERFIRRSDSGVALPTSVSTKNFGTVEEIENMEGQLSYDDFCVVDFVELDRVDVPKTFQ